MPKRILLYQSAVSAPPCRVVRTYLPGTCLSQPTQTTLTLTTFPDGRKTDAESPGCFTMTDIYNWRGTVSSGGVFSSKGPIYQLDDDGAVLETVGEIGDPVTNKWLLTAELYVTDGAIFYCKGTEVGGDCDELRIQSIDPTDWYELRGHGGSLYFEKTIVTSWDTPNKTPQVSYRDCFGWDLATLDGDVEATFVA